MDLPPSHPQEVTASSSSLDNTDSTEPGPVRSSARVKAAKQKSQEKNQAKDRNLNTEQSSSSSADPAASRGSQPNPTSSKRSRESAQGKGKAKETNEEPARRRFVNSACPVSSRSDGRHPTALDAVPPHPTLLYPSTNL
jgi:E3 ubiquitin-protein ligase TRIP12